VLWTQSQLLAPSHLKRRAGVRAHVHRVYLPFYCFDMELKSHFKGDVGHATTRDEFNWRRMRRETVEETTWHATQSAPSVKRYSCDSRRMQVYASYQFRSHCVDAVKHSLRDALPLELFREHEAARRRQQRQYDDSMLLLKKGKAGGEDIHDDDDGGDVDDEVMFESFRMHRKTARRIIFDVARRQETQRGETLLLAAHPGANKVRAVKMEWNVTLAQTHVYMPAYVLEYTHAGRVFSCVVNGVDGSLTRQRLYSLPRVALCALAPISLALTATHSMLGIGQALSTHSWSSLASSVALPAFAIGASLYMYPVLRHWLRGRQRDRVQSQDYARTLYDEYEEEAKRYRQQYDSSNNSNTASPPPSEALRAAGPSHYDVLEIARDATLQQLQHAFRVQSFRHHPDLAEAGVDADPQRYRNVIEAYQVLRDPQQRAAFDQQLR
jgi:hypothetical protein